MPITKNTVDVTRFNQQVQLPYALRVQDFQMAMQDVYDFLYDVNAHLTGRGLQRLDDMLRPRDTIGGFVRHADGQSCKTLPSAQ